MPPEPTSSFVIQGIHISLILAIPFFATFVGTPIARMLAIHFHIVDKPIEGSSKTHADSTPYLGGLPLFLAILFGSFVVLKQGYHILPAGFNLWLILTAIFLIFAVGLWDDVLGMIPGVKMSMLAVAGTILFFGGGRITFIPEAWGAIGQIISWALTLFWILGITNAANLMDNMNGLAAGTGIVAGLSILAIGIIGHDAISIGLSLVLIGGLLGYIPYNFPKASIFFGDAGSIVLGFYLSFLGLIAGRLPSPENLSPLSHTLGPILVMGVLVFDTFFVAFSRGKRKINFWWGGKDHTSHRFVNYGFSKMFAVILVWILGAIFGAVGILVKISPWWLAILLTIALFIGGIWFWRLLDKIPVEAVKIGASNIREKKLQREGKG
ncbi:MAG: MraY family glycosyltransferase [bacterium]|nr:MraY family glycosyltransferase [bacterium]